jgi:hypothetical protein
MGRGAWPCGLRISKAAYFCLWSEWWAGSPDSHHMECVFLGQTCRERRQHWFLPGPQAFLTARAVCRADSKQQMCFGYLSWTDSYLFASLLLFIIIPLGVYFNR